MNRLILLFILLLIHFIGFSQDLEKIKIKDLFKVSGSAGAVSTFYHVNGIEPRRDPFFWQFNANVNVSSVGVVIPISLRLSQQKQSVTQSFNQYGLSPKYKAFTLHLGYRTMKLSEFSLSGNQFFGVGLEVKPENHWISGKVVFGRFAKAVDGYYQDGSVVGTPSYERWGGGATVKIGKENNNIGLVIFKAKDDAHSINSFNNDVTIKPADNLVYGIYTKQKFSKSISFDAEMDWSAYTKDARVPESVLNGYSYLNNLGNLFYANNTSSLSRAMYANLKYKKKNFGLKIKYRRIDPEYKSLGSVYLNNDFEDLSVAPSLKFLKNKLNVKGSLGVQRNNLADDKLSNFLRVISLVSLNYAPNQKWNLASTFSNFNSETNMSLVNSLDTLRYAQVTKNSGFNITRNIKQGKSSITVMLTGNYQIAKINAVTNTEIVSGNLGAQYGITPLKANISLSISANQNNTELLKSSAIGPVLGLGKVLMDRKLILSLSAAILNSYTNGESVGMVYNTKFKAKYKLHKSHMLSLGHSFIKKEDPAKKYSENITTITYHYTFN